MATMLARIGALSDAILLNRRKSPRRMVHLAASVTSSHGERASMAIANISLHGCNITGEAAWLRLGGFVTVGIEAGETMQAIVRWVRDGSAGLEFLRPVPPGHAGWHELINSIADM